MDRALGRTRAPLGEPVPQTYAEIKSAGQCCVARRRALVAKAWGLRQQRNACYTAAEHTLAGLGERSLESDHETPDKPAPQAYAGLTYAGRHIIHAASPTDIQNSATIGSKSKT